MCLSSSAGSATSGSRDVPLVGGKNASLGELYRELPSAGVRVPNGFAITADGYRHFLRASGLDGHGRRRCSRGLQTGDLAELAERGLAIRQAILVPSCPPICRRRSSTAYERLGDGAAIDVAVRSSATAEDLPDASFAGQQETYLNVRGRAALLDACRRSFASLFTDRAISYRADKGFDQLQIALSIGVQRMVRSDLATSGVMFTLDTETGFRDVVLINALVRPGRTDRAGLGDAGRVLRVQADAQTGIRADPAEDGRHARSSSSSTTRAAAAASRRCRSPPAIARGCALTDERDPDAGPLGVRDRGPLQPRARHAHADGHRVGARTAAPASCSSSRPAPKRCTRGSRSHTLEQYRLRERGRVLATGPQHRQQDRRRTGPRHPERRRPAPVSAGRGAGHRQDGSRLGADHEEGRRDRHQPRRAHLPRGHRQPRARRAGDRRHRDRHRRRSQTARS